MLRQDALTPPAPNDSLERVRRMSAVALPMPASASSVPTTPRWPRLKAAALVVTGAVDDLALLHRIEVSEALFATGVFASLSLFMQLWVLQTAGSGSVGMAFLPVILARGIMTCFYDVGAAVCMCGWAAPTAPPISGGAALPRGCSILLGLGDGVAIALGLLQVAISSSFGR